MPPFDPPSLEIGPAELAALRAQPGACALLDVREPWELEICALPDAHHLPLGALAGREAELPTDRVVVVICHHGQRSLLAACHLRRAGLERAVSLRGGLDAWASEIDPAMTRY
jgi:rhodanese-related sulfurtransferase